MKKLVVCLLFFAVMQPPALRFIVKSTILKYLVCNSDISRDHLVMLEYLESFGQGVFGDEILSQIIEDFPNELTDELLIVLSPPHLRHLKLKNCSRLSCNGLQKTITKCQQLQALDFSECIHLLHPTVFCCLKDKAANLVSLSLENSQVVSDDIVQVALMCCPGLKHLNLSSCRSITDAAFNFLESKRNTSSRASANSASSTCTSKPGQNLTSVDVSGCQLLSTLAVKHLVGLCGANLTSVNLAWTGVNCTALLYLAGLHMDQVARLVQETNPSSDNSLQVSEDANQADHTSSKCFTMHRAQPDNKRGLEKQSCADFSKENGQDLQNEPSCSQILQNLTQDNSTVSKPCAISANPFGETERLAVDLHDCDENQLSEMELSRLKDVLPVTCKSSMLMSPDAEHLEDLKSSSDDDSDDSFKTAPDEVTPMLCFPSEEEATFLGSKEENLRHEESSEMQEISSSAVHGHSGVMSAAVGRKVCWNVPVENESSFKNLQTKETSSVEVCGAGVGTLLTCVQGVTSKELDPKAVFGSEHRGEINTIMTIPPEQSKGELTTEETYEDCFDMESHPVISCEGGSNVQSGQFVAKSELKTSSFRRDCDDAIMTVNGKERQNPTMLCKGVKDKELKWVKSEYPNMPCAIVDHRESEFSIELCGRVDHRNTECPLSSAPVKCGESENSLIPCEAGDLKESDFPSLPCEVVMDMELQCENSCMHCEAETGEHTHPVALDFLKETGNKCSHSIIPCTVHENQKPSTWSVLPQTQSEVATKPCWGETSVGPCEEETDSTEEIWDPDCSSSCVRVVQIADLLQRQLYRPQITSLDITNIFYQSKVLGEACLKIFFKACKCLKNFAVSWTELDDGVLTYLLKNAPDLEALSLVDCEKLSNLSVSTIPVHCPRLTSFDLKGMCYVTDHGIMPMTRNNELESLCLAEAAITDSTLESIGKGCGAKLKDLDISWCEDITDRGMSLIASCCLSLQHLSLRQCAASHLTLQTLAANCHSISFLNIAGVDSLTDTALSTLAENMTLLREIDVSWNSSLSDIGITALLKCCTQLNTAALCGLKRITSQPFLAIIGDLGRWCLLEELWRYNRKSPSGVPKGKVALKTSDSETAKSLGDQIPCRSMSYAPSLRQVLLEYSDKVNDDHLAAIVAVCRGTLFVKDYYGQPVESKWIFR